MSNGSLRLARAERGSPSKRSSRPAHRRWRSCWCRLLLVLVLTMGGALAACGASDTDTLGTTGVTSTVAPATTPPPASTSAETSSTTAHTTTTTARVTTTTTTEAPATTKDEAVTHALDLSFKIPEVGDGIGTSCDPPPVASTAPAVRLVNMYQAPATNLGVIVALCLDGFPTSSPITVTTQVGSRHASTVLTPSTGSPSTLYPNAACQATPPGLQCDPPRLPPDFLFADAARSQVFPQVDLDTGRGALGRG